jgi:hypothetical protein
MEEEKYTKEEVFKMLVDMYCHVAWLYDDRDRPESYFLPQATDEVNEILNKK